MRDSLAISSGLAVSVSCVCCDDVPGLEIASDGRVNLPHGGPHDTAAMMELMIVALPRFVPFIVDGKKVDRPSYRLKPGQVVEVRETSRQKPPFQIAATGAHVGGPTAPYLSTVLEELRTTVIREPQRSEIPVICDEQLVVEFYAR